VELRRVEVELARVQFIVDDYKPLVDEKDALQARIEESVNKSAEIEVVAQDAMIQEIAWSNILHSIVQTVPAGVELTMVDQSGYEVVIVGIAESRRLPPSLADALEESGLFAEVVINSLVKFIPPEPSGDEIPATVPPPQYEFEISLDLGGEVEETP